jgi:pSer/pThr/pTyr-binding forkhead associated (FHA) protein
MKKEISITFMSGPLDGKKLSFDQPDVGGERIIQIGRREGCDIHLAFDNQVSRVHARLGCVSIPVSSSESVTNPYVLTFWLEDGGSRNGTFVEKEKEPLQDRVTLRPGTLFRIGRTWLRLDIPMSFDA